MLDLIFGRENFKGGEIQMKMIRVLYSKRTLFSAHFQCSNRPGSSHGPNVSFLSSRSPVRHWPVFMKRSCPSMSIFHSWLGLARSHGCIRIWPLFTSAHSSPRRICPSDVSIQCWLRNEAPSHVWVLTSFMRPFKASRQRLVPINRT